MTHVLSFGLRIRPIRRLLACMRWPRPEHLAKMSPDQFHAYVRAIGLEAMHSQRSPNIGGIKIAALRPTPAYRARKVALNDEQVRLSPELVEVGIAVDPYHRDGRQAIGASSTTGPRKGSWSCSPWAMETRCS